ncbi:MAG: hypothetical protein LBB53_04400 [Prevotellaceae bacterium]|jgi:hypothetical protein|nr:hypothetical protein [Prevotellaceae bacterium]
MIFNKNFNGAQEIHSLTGMYYQNNDFARIETDIQIETRTVIDIVGYEVFKRAEDFYNSLNFVDGEIPSDDNKKRNYNLVKAVQSAIALLAFYRYTQGNLVSHEDVGRKVKIDKTNETMPWEWMIDRDNSAMLRKAYAAVDFLLIFLEANGISEWMESIKRRNVRSVFISSAEEFHDVYPIDKSYRFYYELLPFIVENQQSYLPAAMGESFYSDFFSRYKSNTLTGEDKTLLVLIRRWLALKTIFTACTRFAISVFPEGISQRFLASSGGRHASKEPAEDTVRRFAINISNDAEDALNRLKLKIKGIKARDIDFPIIPDNKPENGFFRA